MIFVHKEAVPTDSIVRWMTRCSEGSREIESRRAGEESGSWTRDPVPSQRGVVGCRVGRVGDGSDGGVDGRWRCWWVKGAIRV